MADKKMSKLDLACKSGIVLNCDCDTPCSAWLRGEAYGVVNDVGELREVGLPFEAEDGVRGVHFYYPADIAYLTQADLSRINHVFGRDQW